MTVPNNRPRPRPPCTKCGGATSGRGKSGLCLQCSRGRHLTTAHQQHAAQAGVDRRRQDAELAAKYRELMEGQEQ